MGSTNQNAGRQSVLKSIILAIAIGFSASFRLRGISVNAVKRGGIFGINAVLSVTLGLWILGEGLEM
jgi:hypothetical protein